MLCRRANCESSHPDLCASKDCWPKRRPDCPKFHGTFKLESEQDKSTTARAGGGRNKPNQGNGQRGAIPPTHSYSSRSSSSSSRNRAGARGANNGNKGKKPTDPKRALEETRRELRVLKGTLGGIMASSTSRSFPSGSNSSSTYSDVVKTGRAMGGGCAPVQQRSSFAMVFAEALERALANAGLHLASSC